MNGATAAYSSVITAEVPRAEDGVAPVWDMKGVIPVLGNGMCEGQHSQGQWPARLSRHEWCKDQDGTSNPDAGLRMGSRRDRGLGMDGGQLE
jgi:hypothetical protein